MKKQILLLIGLCLLSAPLDAQVAIATAKELSMISREVAKSVRAGNPFYIPGKARVGRTGLYPFQVKRVLERRAAKAQHRALKMQQILPWNKKEVQGFLPVSHLRRVNPTLEPLLQTAPVRTPEQINLYLTARENNFFAREVYRRYVEVWAKLAENLPRLRQIADQTTTPADPLGFLARQIPAEVNTIAIGETHGFKDTRLFIARFLTLLRQARPEQEIFVFSEALIEGGQFLHVNGKYSVLPEGGILGLEDVWKAARDNKMPLIGLEPIEVKRDIKAHPSFFEHAAEQTPYSTPVFASLTGMKWRNERFLKTLEQYRAQHPDALFVVHAGGGHVQYTAPFSIMAKLDAQKTFVLRILPTHEQVQRKFPYLSPESRRLMWDPLGDEFNGTEPFDQPFLYFQDPQLARIAGADAFIQTQEKFLDR